MNQAADRLTSVKQVFVGHSMKHYSFKAKFFGSVQVYPHGFVRVVVHKG